MSGDVRLEPNDEIRTDHTAPWHRCPAGMNDDLHALLVGPMHHRQSLVGGGDAGDANLAHQPDAGSRHLFEVFPG